ncbi:ATP-binding protein [Robertmurraya yapensis]|uniref:ATP-binding protein n=2 Tax=Bacillaceae TaxID=186817 RepID=A0A3S0RQF7_9BACI|nr:ATP-binding protein [Bacillus yapensis]RTR33911.1 ATP-binding protein [Bacillus yapensis]TKS97229.1 ATP-binding protein [Bacillus yapensis]
MIANIKDILKQKTENPLIVMMCGVAGSGKTTFAQQLEKIGFVRLSIDEEIWKVNGRYGIDFPVENYENYKVEAENRLRNELIRLLEDKQNVVIDFSFWQRAKRNDYKKLIENAGGEWRLIYLKVSPEVLRERLKVRSKRFDANAAFPITDEILERYLNGFEVPFQEGEIVLEYQV